MNRDVKDSVTSHKEDEVLVRAFQAGDKTALDALVVKYKDKVFNLCYIFLGDRQDANDSAQDVFIKVCRSLKKFRLESAFYTWLYRIVANTCKNRLKSLDYRQKKKMVRLDNPGDRPVSPDISDASPSPVKALEMKERRAQVHKAIGSLPVDKRTVLVLRDIEGLSYEEISTVTGFNLGTVKSRLSRARRELKEKLKGIV